MSTQTLTLTFDMEDSDARTSAKRAIKALDMYLALDAFQDELRHRIKYTETVPKDWEEVRELFSEVLLDKGVDLWDLE